MIGIYKITSPSNKIYIGSSRNIEQRWTYYQKGHCKSQFRLVNSFNKYSVNSHVFEIIEECEFEYLYIRERYWQEFYDVLGENGLNCVLVDSKGKPQIFSDDFKQRVSEKLKGFKHTDKSKEKRSKSLTGKKRNEQAKQNISKGKLGNTATLKYSFIQKTLEGEFIAFYSRKQDLIEKGFDYNCVNQSSREDGNQKQHKGFKWERVPYETKKQYEQ